MNAVQSRQKLSALLVGTPSGGMVNSCGEVISCPFEQFPLTAYLSTRYFSILPGYQSDSLLPDVTIARTLEDVVQGVDPVIDYILEQ